MEVMAQSLLTNTQGGTFQPMTQQELSSYFDFLSVLRFFFYILVVIKLIDLTLFRARKQTSRERIYRKFLYTYSQMFRHMTDTDKQLMSITLNNTITNANIKHMQPKPRNQRKTVVFQTKRNIYYQPRKEEEEVGIIQIDQSDHSEGKQMQKQMQMEEERMANKMEANQEKITALIEPQPQHEQQMDENAPLIQLQSPVKQKKKEEDIDLLRGEEEKSIKDPPANQSYYPYLL